MASPHAAGLMAYFLSLYPSKSFNPDVSILISPPLVQPQTVFDAFFSFILPSWVSSMLSSPVLGAVAPVPLPTLTPAQLKKAVLDLATPDVFATLPPGSPNLILFNNATGL